MNALVALPLVASPISTQMVVAEGSPTMHHPDGGILELEERIFEHQETIDELEPEAIRLQNIWSDELIRLAQAAAIGECTLTAKERSAAVTAMPEAKEHARIVSLMEPHYAAQEDLIKQMWSTRARTSEGKRSKFIVLINQILPDEWREGDGVADLHIRMARDLIFELIGDEPAEQLRNQFSV